MSQVNHNYSYIFEVDGYTVWERLRIIRNFMTDRRQALELAELTQANSGKRVDRTNRKLEYLQSQLESAIEEGDVGKELELEELIDTTQYELQEGLIQASNHADLTQDCRDELNFLIEFESRLATEAEKTRVPGKTDREMYEINFPNEARVRLENRATAEIVAGGRLSADTIHYLRKDPEVLQRLIELEIPIAVEGQEEPTMMRLIEPQVEAVLRYDASSKDREVVTSLVGLDDVVSLPHLTEE